MVTVFYAAYIAGNYTLFKALFLALVSFVGFFLYYGLDPKKEANKIEDRPLYDKVELAIERSNTILNALVDDPKDIRVARKFLVVYLDGIADVVSSYNAVEEEHIGPKTRTRLLELMDEVEKRFKKEYDRLKANNQFDLDVNIDTLKEQIKH
jgi:5-bromo-4-chloroindolyl phosphate hydrolysis protein